MSLPDSVAEVAGFRGDVAGLSLADVVQLNGQSGFSGCITVQHGAQVGRVFFRDGRIVHAEEGGRSGEEAFFDIMAWRSGHFSLEPNISTTSHTIQKSTQFMLMEAHRLIDERRAGLVPPSAGAAQEAGARKSVQTGLAARLKGVAGVLEVVVAGRDGSLGPGHTPEGEALAGKAAFLAVLGNEIGAHLSAGEVRSVAVRDPAEQFLVLVTRASYLGVLVEGARELGGAEVEIMKLVANPT